MINVKALLVTLLLIGYAKLGESNLKGSLDSNIGLSGTRRRKLATGAMRIIIDYSYSDYYYKSQSNNEEQSKYIFAKKLIMKTKDLYVSLLRVKNQQTTNTIPSFTLANDVPISGRTIEGDLLVIFLGYNNATSTSFASAACLLNHESTGRPIAGEFNINLFAIKPSPSTQVLNFGTFVHEFYHIIVFNSELYDKFVDAANKPIGMSNFIVDNLQIGGVTRSAYKGAGVVAKARTHVGDSSLSYVVLENDGGEGSAASHWEYRYWPSDFMSPIDTIPSLVTPMTMAMAEDSGWYEVDYSFTEPMIYGAGAGANFQGDCPTGAKIGFCDAVDKDKSMCSPDTKYKGSCYTDSTFSETCTFMAGSVYCSISDNYADKADTSIEWFGANSRCAMVTQNSGTSTARCLRASCNGSPPTSITYTMSSSTTCQCTTNGQLATCSNANFKLQCPPSISTFCSQLTGGCPNDCSGKGYCAGDTTKKCFCMYGYKGNDCSTPNTDEATPTLDTPKAANADLNRQTSTNQVIDGSVLNTFSILSLIFAAITAFVL